MLHSLIEVAKKSPSDYKHAAYIVVNNSIYPMRYNDCDQHAEIAAISCLIPRQTLKLLYYNNINKLMKNKQLIRKLQNAEIYVIRITKNGIKNSKPCYHCLLILKILKINRVHYSSDNGNIITEKVKNMISTHITKGFANEYG